MANKRIVVFSDGTGNSAARAQKTNVWRLYQALQHNPQQIAFYDDGVGTSTFKPLALLGGAVGFGLAHNVRRIYAYLCRNYQPGDEIFAFGFSRGAFTIRVLVGLIASQGIIPCSEDLEKRVRLAWKAYRRKYLRFGRTRDIEPVKHNVEVKFIGLWDTVDAYGFPIEEMRIAWDRYVLPLAMRDRELWPRVKDAYHALSINDERETFHPLLWTEAGQNPVANVANERITQVWFAGVHSNLGGGYPDDSLSHVSLKWMIEQAERRGLALDPGYREFIFAEADEFGKIYDPRGGGAALYRYLPRLIADKCKEWTHDGRKLAVDIAMPKIHESVFARLRNGTDAYAPVTLPARYNVVLANGDIVPGVVPQITPQTPGAQETIAQADHRSALQARLWDKVWCRRIIYFITLLFSVVTVLVPWTVAPALVDWGNWTDIAAFLPKLLSFVLPDFLSGWLDFYRLNPVLLIILLGLALTFGVAGAFKERQIRHAMHEIWVQSLHNGPPPAARIPSGKFNLWVRCWQALTLRRRLKYKFVPGIVGLLYLVVALSCVSQLINKGAENFGQLCAVQPSGEVTAERAPLVSRCYDTGMRVAKGERYLVAIEVTAPWADNTIPAGPEGLAYGDFESWLIMKLWTPLRRHISEDWFTPMAKIGADGLDSEALELHAESGAAPGGLGTWSAVFTADADGELFVYLNDAVVFGDTRLYDNNMGGAKIAVTHLAP